MSLKKVNESEGASAKAKADLPTHASKAGKQVPDNAELSKSFARPNDVGDSALHDKHLPTHASNAKTTTPTKFTESTEHGNEELEEALEKDAVDAHKTSKHKVDPAFDGHDIANRMKDGVYESTDVDSDDEVKEDKSLEDYNNVTLGEEDCVEIDDESKKEMAEHVNALFANQDLTESFKQKTSTIFEAAVSEQVTKRVSKIHERYEAKLQESHSKNFHRLAQNLSTFVDVVAEEWLAENQQAVEESIEVELAESFFNGLKALFEKHNVVVPKDKVNLLNDISEQNKKLKADLNESIAQNVELRKLEEERRKKEILEGHCKGLSEMEKERLVALGESVSYTSDEEFNTKVETIKESYFPKSVNTMRDISDQVTENPVIAEEKKTSKQPNGAMSAYLDTLTRMERNKK